jgi:hypothetical protein
MIGKPCRMQEKRSGARSKINTPLIDFRKSLPGKLVLLS